MKARSAGLAAALVAAAAVGLWLYFSSRDVSVPKPASGGPIAERPSDPVDDRRVERSAATLREVDASSAPAAADPMPDAYRKALTSVVGRLVETDGTPVPGFTVTLLEFRFGPIFSSLGEAFDAAAPPPAFEIDESATGDDGRFRLEGALGWALHGLGVNLAGPRATLRILDREFPRGETVDVGDIVLVPNVVFTGRIVDEGGNPIAGARVRGTSVPALVFQAGVEHIRPTSRIIAAEGDKALVIEIPPWALAYEKRLPIPTTLTDAEGRFRLEGLPRGLVTVVADHADFVAIAAPSIPTGDAAEREIDALVLPRGRTLAGRVVDSAERPVAGAEVIGGAVIPLGKVAIAKNAVARSGPDGKFTIEHVPPMGAVSFAARVDAHSAWKVLDSTFDDENAVIVLDDAFTLTVLLRTASGDVVPDADVRVRPRLGDMGSMPLAIAPYVDPGVRVQKVEKGKLVVEGLRPGDYELLGKAKNRGFVTKSISPSAASSEVTLEFPDGREVGVVVFDDVTNAPIEWATVSVVSTSSQMSAIDRGRTGADGRCTLAGVPTTSADLANGGVKLVAEHPAYARQTIELAPGDAATEYVFRLVAGGAFAGRVHDGGAVPTKPVMVTLLRSDEFGSGPESAVPRMTLIDLEGNFKIGNLEPAQYRYEVMDRIFDSDPLDLIMKSMTSDIDPRNYRSGEVAIVAGQTVEIDIDISMGALGPTGFLRGVVRVNGEPLAGGRVGIWKEGLQNGLRASCDERGEFSFGEVPAGELQINVSRRVKADESGRMTGNEHVYSLVLPLAPNEDRFLEIDAVAVDMTLIVQDPEGRPVGDCALNVYGKSESTGHRSAWGQTDADGRAKLVVGGPGTYHASAHKDSVGRVSREVELTPSGEPIVLELRPGVKVSGNVVFEEGFAPKKERLAWVYIRRLEGDMQVDQNQTQLDRDGERFEFTNVAPGHYSIMVYSQDGWAVESPFDVPEGGLSNFTYAAKRAPDSEVQKDE